MEEFFSILIEKFKSHGMDSRSKATLNDLKTCLSKTSDSLKAYQSPCALFEREIRQKEKEVRIECQATESAMNHELRPITHQMVSKYAGEQRNMMLKNDLREAFRHSLGENGKLLFGIFGRDGGISSFKVKLKKPSGIPLYKEIKETTTHESHLGSNITAAVGTAIGGYLGVGLFSLVTAPVGGLIGKAAGSLLDGPRKVTVSHGFNTAEVFNGAYRQIEEWSKAARTQLQETLNEWITNRNQTSLSFFIDKIRGLEASVNQSVLSIQEELVNGNP